MTDFDERSKVVQTRNLTM